MRRAFKKAINKNKDRFIFRGMVYRVIDDITIYQYDTDTVLFFNIDF